MPAPQSAVASSTCSPVPCQHGRLQRHPAMHERKGRGKKNKFPVNNLSLLCVTRHSLWRNHNSREDSLTFISSSFCWCFTSRVYPVLLNEILFQLANGKDLTSTTAITTGMQAPAYKIEFNSIVCLKHNLIPLCFFFPLFSTPILVTFPSSLSFRCSKDFSY